MSGYNGLPPYYSESSDPLTPNLGLSLTGCDPIVAENFVLIDTFAGGGGGTSVFVNSSSVSNPNFNNTTPAAPGGFTNVLWQVSGSNVSAYAQSSPPGGSNTQIQFNDSGAFGGDSQFTWDKTLHQLAVGPSTIQPLVVAGSITQKPIFSYGASGIQRLTLGNIDTHYFGDNLEILHVWQDYTTANLAQFPNAIEGHVRYTGTSDTSKSMRGLFVLAENNVNFNPGIIYGAEFDAYTNKGSTSGLYAIVSIPGTNINGADNVTPTVGEMLGIDIYPSAFVDTSVSSLSSLTVTTMAGVRVTPTVSARSTVSQFYGAYFFAPIIDPGGVVTKKTGIFLDDYSGGANDWAIYVTNGVCHFGGNVDISGTFTLSNKTANTVFAGPTTGAPATPAFRALVAADIPALSYVTSVGMTGDNVIYNTTVTGSPVTSSGTLVPVLKSQTANTVLAGPTSGGAVAPTFRSLVANDIPSLDASKITTGQLALARGGTNADLSATGGASQVLRQSSAGAAITVSQLSASDISGLSTAIKWSDLQNASASLTLANAGNASTFNQTSAVNWTWENTTAATSGGTVGSSPIHRWVGHNFSSGVDTQAIWTVQGLHGTALSNATVTTAVENSSSVVTLTFTAHTFTAGMWVVCQNMSTFTWLNNQNVRILTTNATQITFLDPTTHGTQGSAAQTGTVIQIPDYELKFTPSGTAGNAFIQFPAGALPTNNATGLSWQWATSGPNEGFYCPSSQNGGLGVSVLGGAGVHVLQFAQVNNAGNVVPAQVGNINVGNNSAGNTTVQLAATSANTGVDLRAVNTTNVTNPCILFSNNGTLTATSGTQIGYGFGYARGSSTGMTFAPTSGTAVFQGLVHKYTVNQTGGANGAVTGLLVNAVETAVGGTHLLLDLQAGTTGGTSEFAVNNVGKITKYNAQSTVSAGVAAEMATVDLTAQSAAISATTAYAVPAGQGGMYRISYVSKVTTAATTSSVLGGANGFQVVYTDVDDSVAVTTAQGPTSSANTTQAQINGSIIVNAKASTNIQYSIGYTSVGATGMQFNLHIKVEYLG